MPEQWKWSFNAYESLSEPHPVEDWLNSLIEDDLDEVIYLLLQLQSMTASPWRRPEFDPLRGAGGISEIRIWPLRSPEGETYYRLYGYFGPDKREYTLLHGTDKDVKNDVEGKMVAKDRLDKIRRSEARVHRFNF
jgi:hypothetical protein